MQQTFYIKGLHCEGCVKRVVDNLLGFQNISFPRLDLQTGRLDIESPVPIERSILSQKLQSISSVFDVADGPTSPRILESKSQKEKSLFITYAPLLGMFLLVGIVAYIFSFLRDDLLMANIMVGFFLLFGGLKIFGLKGFASSYANYDLIAQRWFPYGYIYPFIEVGFGIAYIFIPHSVILNTIVAIIMGFSTIGVWRGLSNGAGKIKCACLGGFFSVPLSWLTVIENLAMVVMATLMVFIGK